MVGNRYGYTLAMSRPKKKAALDGRRLVSLRLSGEHKPMRIGLIRVAQTGVYSACTDFEEHCSNLIPDNYVPGMEAPILNLRRTSQS